MKKYDIAILESYWTRFEELKEQLKLSQSKKNAVYYANLKTIVDGIKKVYEEAEDDLKKIVDLRYWDKDDNCFEWVDVADELFYSTAKTLRKRNILLKRTAQEIGYIF